MTCYHPLKGFDVGVNEPTGKRHIVVVPFDVKYLYKEIGDAKEIFHRSYENCCWNYEKCFEDKRLCDPASCDNFVGSDSRLHFLFTRYVTIPCGRCIGCRIDNSRDWATRMMLERKYSLDSWFLTLTYSPEAETKEERDFKFIGHDGVEHCYRQFPNLNPFGEFTLNGEDYRNFNKRLLKKFSKRLPDNYRIRFFLCGEYGEENGRSHYHGIYFNLLLNKDVEYELKPYFFRNGVQYYRSLALEDIWGFGRVILGKVTYESCSYVSRYCTKKFFDDPASYDEKLKMPEFIQMSRNPGLGKKWFDENYESIYNSYIITVSGGRQLPVPKYFYRLLEEKDPVKFEEVRDRQRLLGRDFSLGSISRTDKDYLSYLEGVEHTFKHSPKNRVWLKRERIKDA